jgi:hypothetical protein
MTPEQMTGLITTIGTFVSVLTLIVFGYKLLAKGSNTQEQSVVRIGNVVSITLSSLVGSALILAAVGITIFYLSKYYQ